MKIGNLEVTWTGNRLKIGTFEFEWTRNRIVVAAVAAFAVLAVAMNGNSNPPVDTTVTQPSPLPVGNIQLTPEQQARVDLMARGAMLFVFFHESGHMLISELKLPATGPEEDVADEFATFLLTDMLKAAPDNQKDLFASIIFSGAIFWRMAAQDRGTGQIQWSDEHSPDLRRYFNILCIATGADPVRFIPMAVRDGVNEARLSRCAEDYKKKHDAWDALLEPHMKGFFAKMTGGGGHMPLQFGPTLKPEWLAFEQVYRNGGFFQTMLNNLTDQLDMPEDVPVIVKGCNVENAWWSSDTKTITLCHDFFFVLAGTFARHIAAEDNGGGGAPPQQPPGQPPQAPPQNGDVAQALTGRWQCQVPTSIGPQIETDDFLPDGRFAATSWTMQGSEFGTWGSWSLAAPGTISVQITGTNPPGLYNGQMNLDFQMSQPNAMILTSHNCQKVG